MILDTSFVIALAGSDPDAVALSNENIARRAGVLQGQHLASDVKPTLGLADATIAATGLVYNEPVVTDDVDDYGSVDGLQVVTW